MPIDPKEMRQVVHAELDKLPDKCLVAARQMLLEMQMQKLLENLDAAADAARADYRLTPERITKAIGEHRSVHPYHR